MKEKLARLFFQLINCLVDLLLLVPLGFEWVRIAHCNEEETWFIENEMSKGNNEKFILKSVFVRARADNTKRRISNELRSSNKYQIFACGSVDSVGTYFYFIHSLTLTQRETCQSNKNTSYEDHGAKKM